MYQVIFVTWVLAIFAAPAVALEAGHRDSSITLWGELTPGSLIVGKAAPGTRLKLNDKPLNVSEDGRFVLGFGRDAELKQTLSWQLPGSIDRSSRELILSQRHYDIQRVEGVPEQTVTPSADKLERIQKENELVARAREKLLLRNDVFGSFTVPLEGRISGVYGSQRIYNGTPKRPHYGLDYAAPVGTVVKAPLSGVVTLTHPDMFYSGGTLIIDHGFGVSSTFIHLSEVLVREGDEIKQGDSIAKVGSGGRSSGPHLDWRINWFDTRIDPQKVLESEAHKLELN